MMADASTISGSSSIAINPDPLFCDDAVDDWAVLDVAEFVAVLAELAALAVLLLAVLPAVADAVVDADALVPFALLVLSGKPPASAFDALTATAPTTSDFNSWRIDCAPQNSTNINGTAPLTFST
jgi:hypothetical protein